MNLHQDLLASLDLRIENHGHNTRSQQSYELPFPRVDAIRYSYKYQFIKIWNDIPQNIKGSNTVRRFKKDLISHFIDSY